MKPELDRETDALLRSHARRGGARAGDGASAFARDGLSPDRAIAAEHLDADELNAFAENAAPEAARTRYLSHLADCDDCRRAATTLALAANVAPARDEPAVSGEKIVAAPRRAWLAALFAPGAWRYAMPVVALLGVGVVALVLMKQVPRDKQGVVRQDESQPANSTAAGQGQSAEGVAVDQRAQPPAQTQANNATTNDATVATRGEVARRDADAVAGRNEAQAGGVVAPASPGAATSGAGAPVTSGAAQPEVAQRRVEDLPPPPAAVASAPAPAATPAPPQPKPQDDATLMAKDAAKSVAAEEVAEKKEAQKSRRAETRRGEPSVSSTAASRALNRESLNSDDPASADRSGGSRSRQSESRARDDRGRRDSEPADDSSAETRTVAGRKFRRRGDSWVDTAYNSSQAATVMRRNSEQYRALVADEPEIARIANSLGGEVVVVWKGRAYRIKP
jgi:hypothetical protein